MSTTPARPFDTIVKNVRVVRPNKTAVDLLDIGIRDGRFARLAPELAASDAREVLDAGGCWASPASSTGTCTSASTSRSPTRRPPRAAQRRWAG